MVDENINQLINSATQFTRAIQTTNPPPIMGYIINTTGHHRYADIQLVTSNNGIMDGVICMGIPVIGDSVLIVFPEGNYEQALAICPRGLPVPEDVLNDYYTKDCHNYLDNGDFHNQKEGFTGEFTIITDESFTTTSQYCCQLETGQTITKTVDISECNSQYFKFQCYYRGQGQLDITCKDADTGKIIQTLPYSMRYNKKTWLTQGSRWTYVYNRETYPRIEEETTHKKIIIEITNTTPETQMFTTMLIDGLVVFDENTDQTYYPSINDQMEK